MKLENNRFEKDQVLELRGFGKYEKDHLRKEWASLQVMILVFNPDPLVFSCLDG
jgi:hypothetical protein